MESLTIPYTYFDRETDIVPVVTTIDDLDHVDDRNEGHDGDDGPRDNSLPL